MSRLLKNSEQYRKPLVSKNSHNKNDEYNIAHKNALSDGDEKGKGEKNDSIGSLTDITKRTELTAKNSYNKGKEYDISIA